MKPTPDLGAWGGRSQWRNLLPQGEDSRQGVFHRQEVAEKMGRFFDALNTPIAVLVVLFVVVVVNAFLYLGYHSSGGSTLSPTERSGGPQRTIEMTQQQAAPKEPTRPQRSTRPETTLQSTTPTEQSATPSASATSSPSP